MSILDNKLFIKWCFSPITELNLSNTSSSTKLKPFAEEESLWWNQMIGDKENKQWTTLLCQEAVREALILLWYKNVKNGRSLQSTVRDKKYSPDLESDEFVWEVKWRNWTTPGTAWEKILWTPIKYSEVPELYGKPLKIVLLGYQEYEAKNDFACGDLVHSEWWRTHQLSEILKYHKERNIEYIAFTDLLKELHKKWKIDISAFL